MADQFILLERSGNGYFMKPTTGRSDTLAYTQKYVIDASVDFNTGVPFADYTAMVTDYATGAVSSKGAWMVKDISDGTWHIATGAAGGTGAFVVVLFMSRALCTAYAESTQP